MSPSVYHDYLEIVNGPEDGVRYLVTNAAVDVGSADDAGIHLRLDPQIDAKHARLSVISNGYRVRQLGGGEVRVNGKRAGLIRSRVLRSGDELRLGQTSLVLVCAPGGYAMRSHGVQVESDLIWACRAAIRHSWTGTKKLARIIGYVGRRIGLLPATIALVITLALVRPDVIRELLRSVLAGIEFVVEKLRSGIV